MDALDLIDENDTVIGVTDKQTAHANHLAHRIAAVFVFNETGERWVRLGTLHKIARSLKLHVSALLRGL